MLQKTTPAISSQLSANICVPTAPGVPGSIYVPTVASVSNHVSFLKSSLVYPRVKESANVIKTPLPGI